MAFNGSTVLIAVDAVGGSPVVIPCQTEANYALSVSPIDTSCKDSADGTNIPGRRERTISVVYNPAAWPTFDLTPTGVEAVVRHAAETGLQVIGQILVAAIARETFTATVTSYEVDAPDQDKATVSIELAITGAMTPV